MIFLFYLKYFQLDMQQQSVIPEKSPNDDRSYEAIVLPNGIKLLFVHDDKAEKGACSISVGVGSLRDGDRSLGLAHFLQHMLFMGSRKFPRHNEYSEFISLHSGMDNAWTSDEQTNYYFQIANGWFLEGVQRLADFFVEASLTESCIEKERQAVHEECQLRCGEDNSRKWQILKHFASGPYHNHSIGNNQTLNHPLVGEDLREFYRHEYSANRINAVLLSALPIEEMKAKAIPFFLEIANKQLPSIQYQLHYLPTNTGKMIRMKSIKDQAIMQFFWVVDTLRPHYSHHPEKYLTHVLGHQGKNSLLSLLKEREYGSKITSYSHDLPRQSIIGLQIQLTQIGVENYQKVYNLVIDYCAWLKADANIYEEISQASAVSFRFKEKSPNYSYTTELSSNLHRIPPQEVISYKAHYAAFNEELINSFLRQLNPFNLLLVYSNSQDLENPLVQKYLGGNFTINDLPARANENIEFESLVKNPFLPLNTALLPPDSTNTNVIHRGNVYFSRGKFQVCKGGVQLIVHSPQTEVFFQFYSKFLELLFKETTYQAQTLKLQIQYDSDDRININLFGFNDTVQKLLREMIPKLTNIHRQQNAESLFELAKQDLMEEYENFYMGDVDQIAEVHLDLLLHNQAISIPKSIELLQSYQYQAFCELVDQYWHHARYEWVVVGNFNEEFIATLQQYESGNKQGAKDELKCMRLTKDITFNNKLEVEDITTSGCIKYHQIGQYSEELLYRLLVLVNYIRQPYFDKLRTEKQLAYYLRAYSRNSRGVLGLLFLLISSNTEPRAITQHITDFCRTFLEQADADLTPEKFQSIKDSVKSKGLQPHNSLKDYFHFICREINLKTFLFDRKEKERLESYLNPITKGEILNLFRQTLEKSAKIWVVAKNHQQEFEKMNEQFDQFEKLKEGLEYYPEWQGRNDYN